MPLVVGVFEPADDGCSGPDELSQLSLREARIRPELMDLPRDLVLSPGLLELTDSSRFTFEVSAMQYLGRVARRLSLLDRASWRFLRHSFQFAYRSSRRMFVEASVGRLQQASGEAVDTLRRNLTCEQASVEVRAAMGVMDQALKAVELMDVDQRLTAIERRLEETP